MAGCVVDASVILEYLVTGPYTQHAQAFFNQVISEDHFMSDAFQALGLRPELVQALHESEPF